MRRILIVLAAVCALAPPPTDAAVLNCGSIVTYNASWQPGNLQYVELIVQTRRDVTMCPLEVQAEAWVHGAGNAHASRGNYVAEVHMWVPVPSYGTWMTYGKHWIIWWITEKWEYMGTTTSWATVQLSNTQEQRCLEMGGWWNGSECVQANTPIIIDMERNGYRLTSVDDGVRFDLDADGVPELVAWTEPDSDDCFLAVDRNGNGRIDDGRELFGNRSPAYGDSEEPTTQHGFEALKFAEGPTFGPSHPDLVIDRRDAIFSRLLLWCDTNHNGVSEPDELRPVSDTDLLAFHTDYKSSGRRDRHGNQFRLRAKVTRSQGEQYIYDIWLMSR
jgi:hypothetical protein